MKNKCCFILKPATWNKETRTGSPAIYCEARTGYNMVLDDDEVRRRVDKDFCPKHEEVVRNVSRESEE